jgi:predicted alpha/beta-fold hydrolase
VEHSRTATFRPPFWLRNRHIQSVLPSLPIRRRLIHKRSAPMRAACEEVLLDCGDGVRLQSFHSRPSKIGQRSNGRVAVLLHGWEGSADSLYIVSLATALFERGFDVVRLNLRDHGTTHHLNQDLFHSCRLPEVIGALRAVQGMYPHTALSLAGFSLGGNFMLRAAAKATESDLRIDRVVALSPVLEPAETMLALEKGWATYHRYFVRKWGRSLLKKQAAWPKHFDIADLTRGHGLRHMTAELVRRFTDYPDLDAYLNGYAITGDVLATLRVPALIITSLDDPIIPVAALDRVAKPDSLRVVVLPHGGHCGFVETLFQPSWAEAQMVGELCGNSAASGGSVK